MRQETYRMGFEVSCAVLAYLDYDVMEPWFDIEELKHRFSGYAIPSTLVAARRVIVEAEAHTVFQKSAEERLLNPPLAARIRSKRMRNQPQNTKRRHGEEKTVWRECIDKEELIDTEFKIWLEKRKEEWKVAEEKWKEDPKYCYETEKEGVIQLTDEAYDQYQGPVSKEIYETVKSGQKAEKPVRAVIPPTRGEANEREINLLLHHPLKQHHLEYSLGHLGEIAGVSLDRLPQGPGYWTWVVHATVQNMGLNEMDVTAFTTHFVEMAVQLSGIRFTDSAIPQVLHPVIGLVITDRVAEPDLRV